MVQQRQQRRVSGERQESAHRGVAGLQLPAVGLGGHAVVAGHLEVGVTRHVLRRRGDVQRVLDVEVRHGPPLRLDRAPSSSARRIRRCFAFGFGRSSSAGQPAQAKGHARCAGRPLASGQESPWCGCWSGAGSAWLGPSPKPDPPSMTASTDECRQDRIIDLLDLLFR